MGLASFLKGLKRAFAVPAPADPERPGDPRLSSSLQTEIPTLTAMIMNKKTIDKKDDPGMGLQGSLPMGGTNNPIFK